MYIATILEDIHTRLRAHEAYRGHTKVIHEIPENEIDFNYKTHVVYPTTKHPMRGLMMKPLSLYTLYK